MRERIDESTKRIFLIGDSIRVGYDEYVREQMAGEALLYWPEDNARFVSYTLRYIHEWAAHDCRADEIDIVHWNNGLWDTLHLCGDEVQTDEEGYRLGLRQIIKRLRTVFPKARIVFALSTCVVEEYYDRAQYWRENAAVERYNAIAREVMAEEGVAIDDLYAVSKALPLEWHAPDGTHYTAEGYRALGQAVADYLRAF